MTKNGNCYKVSKKIPTELKKKENSSKSSTVSHTRIQHRRSVIKQQNKKKERNLIHEFIQECSLWSRQLQCSVFVVSEIYILNL